ncbi:hypothetical protein [Sphingomonas sp. NIC1]|uniref:DUF7146 domain-containing protein n=1 Tax=Sphingomonas sp. NIC1 TaxID=1961362 RepID=UPI001CF707E3|nr:hypothetical protein [Sphingomonas sp. NIC1]
MPIEEDAGVVAIHRTFLTPDGGGKADMDEPKRMLGNPGVGAVRWGGTPLDGILRLAEGVEDAASVMNLLGPGHFVWPVLGIERYQAVAIPESVHTVVIYSQHGGEAGARYRARHPAPDGQGPPARRQTAAPCWRLERPLARDPFAMKLFPGATRFQRWTMSATFLVVATYAISQNRHSLAEVSKTRLSSPTPRIIDGDTIDFPNGRVRVVGIDAPDDDLPQFKAISTEVLRGLASRDGGMDCSVSMFDYAEARRGD